MQVVVQCVRATVATTLAALFWWNATARAEGVINNAPASVRVSGVADNGAPAPTGTIKKFRSVVTYGPTSIGTGDGAAGGDGGGADSTFP